ncbi:phosphate ABC transporter permease PstA [Candidatus Kapaibacterium sp.]
MKNLFDTSTFFIWTAGIALGVILVIFSGIIYISTVGATDYFVPGKINRIQILGDSMILGQIISVQNVTDEFGGIDESILVKVGNREIYGYDFVRLEKSKIKKNNIDKNHPIIIERMQNGNFIGYLNGIVKNTDTIYFYSKPDKEVLLDLFDISNSIKSDIRVYEVEKIGNLNSKIDNIRRKINKLDYQSRRDNKAGKNELRQQLEEQIQSLESKYSEYMELIDELYQKSNSFALLVSDISGNNHIIPAINIHSYYYPNDLGIIPKIKLISKKLWEFVVLEPRESNTEGGIFPAIFGTVMMVILMSIIAVPIGVVTALFLNEYAGNGWWVKIIRITVYNLAGVPSIVFGIFGLGFFIYGVGGTIDSIFYPEYSPAPVWGTGGILWASLTLALLTVPVVIVSTEEALSSIPTEIREASIALGATKLQMVSKILLPASTPGIMTGLILAIARGAGEVAPLMITGVVKLAPDLPLDSTFPFFHLERKFMHLGFHIYDVGFQSPNVEAGFPMLFMTTLLLIIIVVMLNMIAIHIRSKLRQKISQGLL